MNELLSRLGNIVDIYIGLIVFWFLVTQLPVYRWRLFFAKKGQITSLQEHEIYSGFITSVCFLMVRFTNDLMTPYLLMFDSGMNSRIKVFYLSGIVINTALITMIFVVHELRSCLFSKASRICLYATLLVMSLFFLQLGARGYVNFHGFNNAYSLGIWLAILIAISAMSLYPIRQTLAYFNKEKEAKD
ncbi:hypothetical protein [Pseudoalteromonas sp. A25]|uniref:hypothetical protein n=1 Tax=Pseudoalteromonas sp. A25 TaxID=116092 RepID=UPI0012613142|nr:hypothetical protein [Pseudoalteromonas sp. A25]